MKPQTLKVKQLPAPYLFSKNFWERYTCLQCLTWNFFAQKSCCFLPEQALGLLFFTPKAVTGSRDLVVWCSPILTTIHHCYLCIFWEKTINTCVTQAILKVHPVDGHQNATTRSIDSMELSCCYTAVLNNLLSSSGVSQKICVALPILILVYWCYLKLNKYKRT